MRVVLFDLDGVLVLTEPLKGQAHAATIRTFGGNARASLYAEVMGQSHEAVRSAFLAAGRVDAEPEKYTETFRRIYRDLLRTNLETRRGAADLVRELAGKGYRLGPGACPSIQLAQKKVCVFFGEQACLGVAYVEVASMCKRYRSYNPEQQFLMPPSMRDWLPESHLC